MKKLIIILFTLLFTSCIDDIGVCKVYYFKDNDVIDTVVFVYVERMSDSTTYVEYYRLKELNRTLRYDTVENLYDKLQVYIESNEIKQP